MALHIDAEPSPRWQASPSRCPIPDGPSIALSRSIRRPDRDFFDVLNNRKSAVGCPLSESDLSSLVWHSTLLRARRAGRFGIPWESRSAPSAGGLHPIRLLVLPIENAAVRGLYDHHEHALIQIDNKALDLNRESIDELLGQTGGTTLQLAADAALIDACYTHGSSLMWRDAGALLATICLVATALELQSTAVGRTGEAIVRAAAMPPSFVGVGAVHISSKAD